MNMNGINKAVLIFSMAMSFLTSFDTKLLSKDNILTHLAAPLILGASKIVEMFINITIYIINKFSYIVSAPILNNVDFRFDLTQCNRCPNGTVHPLIIGYFVVVLLIICSITFGHYGDLNSKKYGNCTWGDY